MSVDLECFETGAQRVHDLISQIESNLAKVGSTPANERRSLNLQIDGQMNDLSTALTRMTNDLSKLGGGDRDRWQKNIVGYRETSSRLSISVRESRSNAAVAGAAKGSLAAALRLNQDTSVINDNLLDRLADDRQHLENTHRNADGVNDEAQTASNRLKAMWWRAMLSKIFAWIVVVVLAGIFVLSCGIKFGVITPGQKAPSEAPASKLPADD
jgi:hypothetical protein